MKKSIIALAAIFTAITSMSANATTTVDSFTIDDAGQIAYSFNIQGNAAIQIVDVGSDVGTEIIAPGIFYQIQEKDAAKNLTYKINGKYVNLKQVYCNSIGCSFTPTSLAGRKYFMDAILNGSNINVQGQHFSCMGAKSAIKIMKRNFHEKSNAL
ncbi:hypothetical protein [Photobacterium carnosum]|jgi:hypothetical protein|uniref:hypothetical protein n=1 Tax=Photobacterium carnosum TaxID=2023717 RepID=UPI001E3B012D|nr:hypothetical protein [Photobacterium carnosum]MCD9528606.1 hypothetical protein [Photobacterium carnosum]MCD9541960.1 hypothetical protein [Photobacterium carnosum]MCD9543690.1 hypothetical protein [Photobacterium carnosum]MCF2152805.1 hypothetical protein [Photobacterium carnosum]MCF2214565.1 hypothetical protein [Photobacterium carnosum]